jgi:hypothetical protein
VAHQITGLVRQHVKDGWKHDIHNPDGYKRFNIRRFDTQLGHLGWSSSVPFDHSILLWHIATDLCFHYPVKFFRGEDGDTRQRNSNREISNYMIYLLSACPEMLMPGIRPGLFSVAANDIGDILSHSSEPPLDTEESLAREIISIVKSTPATTTYSVIRDACRLAEALMKLDDKERWTVIQSMCVVVFWRQ